MKEKYIVVIQRADKKKFTYTYYKGTKPFILSLSSAIEIARKDFEMSNSGELISAKKQNYELEVEMKEERNEKKG